MWTELFSHDVFDTCGPLNCEQTALPSSAAQFQDTVEQNICFTGPTGKTITNLFSHFCRHIIIKYIYTNKECTCRKALSDVTVYKHCTICPNVNICVVFEV